MSAHFKYEFITYLLIHCDKDFNNPKLNPKTLNLKTTRRGAHPP